jgi:hypothetical protein
MIFLKVVHESALPRRIEGRPVHIEKYDDLVMLAEMRLTAQTIQDVCCDECAILCLSF